MHRTLIPLFLLVIMAAGCATTESVERRNRADLYESPCESGLERPDRSEGSLYTPGNEMIFVDQRAYRLCDIVTVKVVERSSAAGSAGTQLSKQTELDARVDAFLGLMGKLEDISGRINGDKLLDAATGYAFKGEGSTKRNGSLNATVTVYVRRLLPNDHLFIEGTKTILVNNEEQYFYISGVIRQSDIDGTNTIPSTLISDAQVEFTGKGVISDVAEPGILSQWFGWLWPF